MLKRRHAQRYMLAFDERFQVPLKSAHAPPPFFNSFSNVFCKLWMEKKGSYQLVAVELWFEHKKPSPRDCIFNTLSY